jgi:hypothetical protein
VDPSGANAQAGPTEKSAHDSLLCDDHSVVHADPHRPYGRMGVYHCTGPRQSPHARIARARSHALAQGSADGGGARSPTERASLTHDCLSWDDASIIRGPSPTERSDGGGPPRGPDAEPALHGPDSTHRLRVKGSASGHRLGGARPSRNSIWTRPRPPVPTGTGPGGEED